MKSQAEIGAMQPQVQECLEFLEGGKVKEGHSPRICRERESSPVDTGISDFQLPELQKNTFLLSEATKFMVIYYSSHRERIHPLNWESWGCDLGLCCFSPSPRESDLCESIRASGLEDV